MRADQATEPITFHGEGPFWDAVGQRLLVVDMLAGDVVDLADPTAPGRHRIGAVAAAIRARSRGGFVAATEHEFVLLDDALAVTEVLPVVFSAPEIRMNDGGCDPQGRFYCGSMAYDYAVGAATLYRLDPDRSVHTVLEKVTISNGLQWTADGSTVYYNDTQTGRVDRFDFDAETGEFTNRRAFATIEPGDGSPDGMTIDTEDGVWIALWGGKQVRRYAPDGSLSEVVELPVSNISACAFGDADLGTLYITTSRFGMPDDDPPEAGAVFSVRPGVTGAPQHAFAG